MGFLAVIFGLFALSLVASVLAVGLYLSSPARARIGLPPPTLPGAEAITLQSGSGAVLHGWWVPVETPGGGVVVLLHGVWANRLAMLPRAETLRAHGFSVLLFDFQAHGESTGRHITFGARESDDAAAAVAFVHARKTGERIGAIGISLGGAAALLGKERLTLDALVLESVYPDIHAALTNRLRNAVGPQLGPWISPILAWSLEALLPPIIGAGRDDLRPIARIGEITAPLLIASGTADTRTPLAEAQALFDTAHAAKRFWAVEGAGHVDLERYDPDAYWRVVLPFLTENLRPPH